MILTSDNKLICASHILIPHHDPKGKIKDKKLIEFVKNLNNEILQKPEYFGAGSYQYSICPSGQNNAELNTCLNKIYSKNEKEFRKKAEQCIINYGGNLGCFTKDQVDKKFFDTVSNLKIGEITKIPVSTDFGYHIIRRDPIPK